MNELRLFEIKALPLSFRGREFFYGVPSARDANRYLSKGTIPAMGTARKNSDPIAGRVYFANSLKRACEFANCEFGVVLPQNVLKANPFGYVFITDTSALSDIFPNESEIGRAVQRVYDLQYGDKKQERSEKAFAFLSAVWRILDRDEQVSLIHNKRDALASVGKKVMFQLPESYLLWILMQGNINITNVGEVEFKSCYMIDRKRLKEYKRDGSNFYEISEKVR